MLVLPSVFHILQEKEEEEEERRSGGRKEVGEKD